MLDNKGFDLWANNYDETVDCSDMENSYPFAGYKELMNSVFKNIIQKNNVKILDIGIGTGLLCNELYKMGYKITGIDFSEEMLKICKEKMPFAEFMQYDFSKRLPEKIKTNKYDFIISTYAIHHLTDDEKYNLINELLELLAENGKIIIGDVSFKTKIELEECRISCKDGWDEDEYYFVFDEIKDKFIDKIKYTKVSFCAGILEIWK